MTDPIETVMGVIGKYFEDLPGGVAYALAQDICKATGLDSGKLCRAGISVDAWGYGVECTLPEGHAGEVHTAGPYSYSGRHSR